MQAVQTKTFRVEGMMCEACVGHVTRALQGLNGIQSVRVDLAEERAVVTYDPAQVRAEQMSEAIAEEGYRAGVAD